jgi:hypothetical protein
MKEEKRGKAMKGKGSGGHNKERGRGRRTWGTRQGRLKNLGNKSGCGRSRIRQFVVWTFEIGLQEGSPTGGKVGEWEG